MLGRLESGTDVMRDVLLIAFLHVKRATINERIHSAFLGIHFIRGRPRTWRTLDEFIVTRPERKLILQILRLDDVNRRMLRRFDSFIAQIKSDFGRAIAFIGDEEKPLP